MKQIFTLALLVITCRTASAQLYIQNGAAMVTTGKCVVTLLNTDLLNNGSFSQAPTGKLLFTGSGNNSIGGNVATAIDTLEIAKTGSGKLLLDTNIQISSAINFTSGSIDLNNNNILLLPGARLGTETETSHVTGISGGSIQTSITAPADLPVLYNAGNLGAAITTTQNLGTLSVTRVHAPVVNVSFTGIQRSFLIQPSNDAGLNASLRFYYLDEELNGRDESMLTLWRSDDGINWTQAGADNRNSTENYVEKNGINSLSTWTLTDINNALPVTLRAFKASCQDNYALLQWETASEENAALFVVQKNTGGSGWTDIGTVPAQNRTSGASYSYKDVSPQSRAFYRLKMVDKDGRFTVSPVFSGGCNDLPMPFMVYPNPVHDVAIVRLSSRQNSQANLQLYNSSGQLVGAYSWTLGIGTNSLRLAVGGFAAGVYLLRVQVNGEVLQAKMIKQ